MFTKLLWRIAWPVRVLTRPIRRWLHSSYYVSRVLFAYDRMRFCKYAGAYHENEPEALLAKISMAYHVVEKGLTMPRKRLGFGQEAVSNLIHLIEKLEHIGMGNRQQVIHASGVVRAYWKLHRLRNFDFGEDSKFRMVLEGFCRDHANIACADQISTTAVDFFRDINSPFPEFARSRHTVRHYAGVVSIAEIQASVELAMTAPSACNRQHARVHCICNHKTMEQIYRLQNGNRGFGLDADKLLIVTTDLLAIRWPEERNDTYTNAGIFTMNLSYALHYNKIAHCILNWSVKPEMDIKLRTLVQIPECESVALLIACGRAPNKFEVASSPRRSVTSIFKVHE